MSVDTLDFRLRLARGQSFDLDMSESIPMNGITAIAGPSGGGKTTLLRALAGLEPCKTAEVVFRGKPWDGEDGYVPTEERRIGFVFQDTALFPHLTVQRNLGYGAKRRDVETYDAIIEALDLGALLDQSVVHLSGGEARRVALGRALASDPAILFLDEPLSGLDNDRKAELLPYIGRAVAQAQVPALYVTHSAQEITALADRVLSVSKGRLNGWKTPPDRLLATVIATTSDTMTARLNGATDDEDADIVLPLIAGKGEIVGLGLPPDSVMLSATHPGRSDAALHLPATVVEGANGLSLNVFGQMISIPRGGLHAVGSKVWVSILKVSVRPEIGDSANSCR